MKNSSDYRYSIQNSRCEKPRPEEHSPPLVKFDFPLSTRLTKVSEAETGSSNRKVRQTAPPCFYSPYLGPIGSLLAEAIAIDN
jgi:hypothetical protein